MPQLTGPAAVTVITPTRLVDNRISFLSDLHTSLHQQSLAWHWVLALDGADPDKVPGPIASDPRVEVLPLPRWVGAATARNLALGHAHAPWVAFVDDDDLLTPDSLVVRHTHAEANRLGWVAGLAMDLQPDGSLHPSPAPRVGTYRPGEVWSMWSSPEATRPPIGHTTMLTRRQAALAVGGQGGLVQGEDYIYVLQVTGRFPGAVLSKVTNLIRSHPEQMTRGADYETLERAVRTYSWAIGHALTEQVDDAARGSALAPPAPAAARLPTPSSTVPTDSGAPTTARHGRTAGRGTRGTDPAH